MTKSYIITPEQAQCIINIACETWKEKLATKWSTFIVLNKDVYISKGLYREMRAACTSIQHILFDEIFGEDDNSVDLSNINVEDLRKITCNLMDVRDSNEYKNKAFYLLPDLNWEIRTDSMGLICLIPTKKK